MGKHNGLSDTQSLPPIPDPYEEPYDPFAEAGYDPEYGDEPYELNWVNHPYQYPVFTNKKNNVVFVDQYEVIYVRGRGKTVLKANIHGRKINIKVTVQ